MANPSTQAKEGPNIARDSKEGALRRSVSSVTPNNFPTAHPLNPRHKALTEKIREIDRSLSPLATDDESFGKTEEMETSSPTGKEDTKEHE